ncbi:MAG: acylphosphatase [Desulfurivibrio sp.]|nr:acylphosphatase [Desulfurivibrio sp.]
MTKPASKIRLKIEGRVQGVFFRDYTKQEADRLGLDGWVRNLPDGAVEALFAGPAEQVQAAVAWCHKGSPQARVSKITELPPPEEPLPPGFQVRY